jgi:hypothetical protein
METEDRHETAPAGSQQDGDCFSWSRGLRLSLTCRPPKLRLKHVSFIDSSLSPQNQNQNKGNDGLKCRSTPYSKPHEISVNVMSPLTRLEEKHTRPIQSIFC